jgi:UDP-N-acetylmuramoyl-L-alanyl-D-glutamate--2,6-diaminopimelate ligase
MLTLTDLFSEFPFEIKGSIPAGISITGIVSDSRKVEPGTLFVAVQGDIADGHNFIKSAIERGASAVVGERPLTVELTIPYIQVPNSRQALAYLAAAFYGYPARKMTMIGVTGTDGKTTTCNLLYQILIAAGLKAGMISTVNAVVGDEVLDTGFHVTTPDAVDIQHYLAMMAEKGLTHVILETTSHGWAQFRVDACEFDIGVVTNITHEHLDYHGSFEKYRGAKARLFTELGETHSKKQGNINLGVLNRDDSSYDYLRSVARAELATYGVDSASDFRADSVENTPGGISFDVLNQGEVHHVTSPLVGAFNVSNCLAAFTTAVRGIGIKPETAVRGICSLTGIPGRMERIDLGQNFTAIVDFAHTPNALASALKTARQITSGRVIAVFGSAGLRDREKRRLMAETAIEFADLAIFTAEDPRTESVDTILKEMARGAFVGGGAEGKSFWRIPDRREAIRTAVKMASTGDLVISCGKGHEQSMCFGEIEYPWDDRVAMRSVLAELLNLPPIEMPFLPTVY